MVAQYVAYRWGTSAPGSWSQRCWADIRRRSRRAPGADGGPGVDPYRAATVLAFAFGVSLALRWAGVDAQSLWADELFSAFHVKRGLAYLWTEGFLTESSPPLYYTLLLFWTSVFGDGAAALRGLSVLLSALLVPVLYLAGLRLDGRLAGLVAAISAVASPAHIMFAQEARPYALLALVAGVALLGFAQALQQRRHLLFVAAMCAAVYTHTTALFLWAGFNIAFVAAAFSSPLHERRALRPWTIANLTILVAALPQIAAAWVQRADEGLAWMPYPSLHLLAGIAKSLLFAPGMGAGLWLAAAASIFAALGLLAASILVLRRRPAAVVAATVVLPVATAAILVLVSFWRPVLLLRTALVTTIPLFVLFGVAIAALRPLGKSMFAAAVVAAMQLAGVWALHDGLVKEPWRELVSRVAATAAADDLFVFLSAEGVPAFAYYWPVGFDFSRCRLLERQGPEHEFLPELDATDSCRTTVRRDEISQALSAGFSVWLVARGERNIALLHQLSGAAAPRPGETFEFGGPTQPLWGMISRLPGTGARRSP